MTDDNDNKDIRGLVDNILDGELAKAEDAFNAVVDAKVRDSLDSQRVNVAGRMFSSPSSAAAAEEEAGGEEEENASEEP